MYEEFSDPRLTAIWETINVYDPGTQPDFYLALARDLGAASLVDLGCGSGTVTQVFADAGLRITASDPSAQMIALARERSGCEQVTWLVGSAEVLGAPDADMAIMTGHVAQFFVDDAEWAAALHALHDALRPGGTLAFEARNPEERGWERWTPASTNAYVDATLGPITCWSDWHDVTDGVVSYTNYYRIDTTGEELASPSRLRFRREAELRASLTEAGFTVDAMYGSWARDPVGPTQPEFITIAHRD